MRGTSEKRDAAAAAPSWRAELRVVGRYALFQLPELAAVVAILMVLVWAEVAAARTAALFCLLWVAKDAALYPLTRAAYRHHDPADPHRMIGRRGVARRELSPRGWVFVGGALWRAEVGGNEPLAAGTEIEVVDVRGIRLTVVAARAAETDPGSEP